MAHDDETEAFGNFLDVFPEQATLLVDTYDVRRAIDRIIALGRKPASVRLDSGDVLADSLWTRKRLDDVGWKDVQIFVSGDLDENRIETLLHSGAPVDAFGVGTALSTSADAPYVGVIYKLVEVELDHRVRGTAKFSEDKKSFPGRKQVFRFVDAGESDSGDIIGLEDEAFPSAERLLISVVRHGRRLERIRQDPKATVQTAQARFLACKIHLPMSANQDLVFVHARLKIWREIRGILFFATASGRNRVGHEIFFVSSPKRRGHPAAIILARSPFCAVDSVDQLRQDFWGGAVCKCDTHKALDFSTFWFGTRRSMVQIHSPRSHIQLLQVAFQRGPFQSCFHLKANLPHFKRRSALMFQLLDPLLKWMGLLLNLAVKNVLQPVMDRFAG